MMIPLHREALVTKPGLDRPGYHNIALIKVQLSQQVNVVLVISISITLCLPG